MLHTFLQKHISKTYRIVQKQGFTLAEMIVVVAIIGVVTTLVLFNNARLNSVVLVSNTAYEIGLIVREAQVAGLGVKASEGGTFSSSHGVHMSMSNPSLVVMFADKNGNGMYDVVNGELMQEFVIQNSRAGSLLGLCLVRDLTPATTEYCTGANTKESINIVFKRPNPEAFFKVQGSVDAGYDDYIGAVVITVGFPGDVCRSVTIEKTGAVEVHKNNCEPIVE